MLPIVRLRERFPIRDALPQQAEASPPFDEVVCNMRIAFYKAVLREFPTPPYTQVSVLLPGDPLLAHAAAFLE